MTIVTEAKAQAELESLKAQITQTEAERIMEELLKTKDELWKCK